MKRVRKFLVVVAVVSCFIALVCFLCFTTAEIPSFLMKSGGSADRSSGEAGRALVLKWFRLDSLESGDLILVTRRSGDEVVREIRKLEKIESPDESERQKVPEGGRFLHSPTGGQREGITLGDQRCRGNSLKFNDN